MTETQTLPPRYYQYISTQSRVSDWVSQTHSFQKHGRKPSTRREAKYATDKQSTSSNSLSLSRKRSPASRKTSTDVLHPPTLRGTDQDQLSPAIALVSSSLVICAFLPYLLAVSVFVAILTWASMDSEEHAEEPSVQEFPGAEK